MAKSQQGKPKLPPLRKADVREFLRDWLDSNVLIEDHEENANASLYGLRLARLIHACLLHLKYPTDGWSEADKILITEWTIEAWEEFEPGCSDYYGFDPDETAEVVVDRWDKVMFPLGWDPILATADRARQYDNPVPGAYPGKQHRLATFLWHMLRLLPDDPEFDQPDIKYLSNRRAAQVAFEFGLVKSGEAGAMSVWRAYQSMERNNVIKEAEKGGMRPGVGKYATRFKLLRK